MPACEQPASQRACIVPAASTLRQSKVASRREGEREGEAIPSPLSLCFWVATHDRARRFCLMYNELQPGFPPFIYRIPARGPRSLLILRPEKNRRKTSPILFRLQFSPPQKTHTNSILVIKEGRRRLLRSIYIPHRAIRARYQRRPSAALEGSRGRTKDTRERGGRFLGDIFSEREEKLVSPSAWKEKR